ncbi:MAG: restriction endonuclease subunit S [Chloroflexi bacterium]|nr:restriction endonuclease subunit S [Chloroflexota bacterium]
MRIKYGFGLIGSGTTPPTGGARYFDGIVPWVNTSELRENVIFSTEKTLTNEAIAEFTTLKTYPAGTVLFAMYGATIGRVAILGVPATVNQAVCALAEPNRFYPRFAFYGLQASREFLASSSSGGGQPNLNAEKVRDHKLPCPDMDSQHTIVDYLDREAARVDALILAKERLLGLLAEKRRGLITHAVTRGLDPGVPLRDSGIPWLGEIPVHWNLTRLKFVAEVRGGLALGQSYRAAEVVEYPYLRVANVQDGRMDLAEVATVRVPKTEAESCLLQVGDVLMTEGGDADKLGRGCIWTGEIAPCLHQNHVFAVRPKLVGSDWLNAWTCADIAKAFFESRAKRSTNLASISATNIGELPIVIPPVSEQSVIVARITEESDRLDLLRAATERSIALLKERRAALITAAVTGQINVCLEAV